MRGSGSLTIAFGWGEYDLYIRVHKFAKENG